MLPRVQILFVKIRQRHIRTLSLVRLAVVVFVRREHRVSQVARLDRRVDLRHGERRLRGLFRRFLRFPLLLRQLLREGRGALRILPRIRLLPRVDGVLTVDQVLQRVGVSAGLLPDRVVQEKRLLEFRTGAFPM